MSDVSFGHNFEGSKIFEVMVKRLKNARRLGVEILASRSFSPNICDRGLNPLKKQFISSIYCLISITKLVRSYMLLRSICEVPSYQ